MSSLVALLDSCAIFPMPLCDTLMRAAEKNLFQLRFSQETLDGATRNLVLKGKMTPEKAKRFQSFILKAFPDSLVEVPEALTVAMTNHEGDRHVLAAAVIAKADVIITANLKHFPKDALLPWGVEAQHPDEFLNCMCNLHGEEILYNLLQEQAADLKNPPQSVIDLLSRLEREEPNFSSRMFLYGYGTMLTATARLILNILCQQNKQDNSRRYIGQNYEICETGIELIIAEKNSTRRVLETNREWVQGRPCAKDIKVFQEADQCVPKEHLLRKYEYSFLEMSDKRPFN
jgi:predicted nucleic acid-binding protein